VKEPFTYANLLHSRWVLLQKAPTREELSLLLYLFQAWGQGKVSPLG
jgi:hypothetical protein